MSDSGFTSLVYVLTLGDWIGVAMDALAIFEYVTTLDQGLTSVWKRRQSGASLLLFAVRFTMLALAILNLPIFATLSSKECLGFSIMNAFLGLLGDTLVAAFSALRIYALCSGNMRLSAIAFLLQMSPVVLNVYGYIESTPVVDPYFGCVSVSKYDFKTQKILIYASRIPLTVGDVFVIIVTWIKSYQQLHMQRSVGVHLTLSALLLRDGTTYFLILLVLNILEITPLKSTNGGFVIGVVNSSLPLILVNRFILNLRQLNDSEVHSASRVHTISTPMFQMSLDIAGNMGEPLEHGWNASEVYDAEEEGAAVLEDEELGPQAEEVRENVGEVVLEVEQASEGVAQA